MTSSLTILPLRALRGRMSHDHLSDCRPGCSPDPEERNTPGRSTARSQLLRIVLFGKRPEQGHASGSHEPSAFPVDPTQGLFLAVVERKNPPKQEAVSELLPSHEESCWNLLCWESKHRENPHITNARTVHNALFVLGPGVNLNCTQVH